MPTNREIASILHELARLTVLVDGSNQSFRVRAYEAAARAVESSSAAVAEMSVAELTALKGIGRSTASKIRELVDTGSMEKLDHLRSLFPPPFQELTRVPGVGPKTALALRDHLGVESVDDLRVALAEERVRTLPGLGRRTEENIARSIERLGLGGKDRRTPIIEAMRTARDIADALGALPEVERAEVMGSLRRFRETIGDVDVIVTSDGDSDSIMERFVGLPVVRDVVAYGARKSAIIASSGIQVDVRVVRPEQFGSAAMYFTGSKAHNVHLRQLAIDRGWILNEYGLSDTESDEVIASATEEEVYAALGLQWVPPEIREDTGEVELAAAGELPRLVEEADLRGDLHVHTDLSGDGREPLEAMLAAAHKRGYEYVGLTDHAENLTINGASREQLLEQRDSIDRLRNRFDGMEILQGSELNIGPDGTIDYDPDFLAGFGWGVASIHSHFDLDRDTQTRRIVEAMRNPAVNAIGHLSGRRIGKRPGVELDLEIVLEAAELTGCAVEINCHLDRLDAAVEVLQVARGRDVVFTIDTDAHDTRELRNTVWGVRHARRGWVTPDRVANTWPRERFLEWVSRKRATKL